jgi:hypothetical protein
MDCVWYVACARSGAECVRRTLCKRVHRPSRCLCRQASRCWLKTRPTQVCTATKAHRAHCLLSRSPLPPRRRLGLPEAVRMSPARWVRQRCSARVTRPPRAGVETDGQGIVPQALQRTLRDLPANVPKPKVLQPSLGAAPSCMSGGGRRACAGSLHDPDRTEPGRLHRHRGAQARGARCPSVPVLARHALGASSPGVQDRLRARHAHPRGRSLRRSGGSQRAECASPRHFPALQAYGHQPGVSLKQFRRCVCAAWARMRLSTAERSLRTPSYLSMDTEARVLRFDSWR